MSSENQSLSDPRDETIRQQAETIGQLTDRLRELEEQVKGLKALLEVKADAKASKMPTFKENYRLDRNKKTNKKNKPKHKPTQDKNELVAKEVDIYPAGVDPGQCKRQRSQHAWRIVDGKAVYVCYQMYDLPESTNVSVPVGLRNSRSEFGIEIILIFAFLHFWIGVSLDNARSDDLNLRLCNNSIRES